MQKFCNPGWPQLAFCVSLSRQMTAVERLRDIFWSPLSTEGETRTRGQMECVPDSTTTPPFHVASFPCDPLEWPKTLLSPHGLWTFLMEYKMQFPNFFLHASSSSDFPPCSLTSRHCAGATSASLSPAVTGSPLFSAEATSCEASETYSFPVEWTPSVSHEIVFFFLKEHPHPQVV